MKHFTLNTYGYNKYFIGDLTFHYFTYLSD